jgi:hypothetical protein
LSAQEKLININDYLSSSKKMLGKSVVDAEKIREMVKEIQDSLPRELEQSEIIISQKESILNDASEEAEKLSSETSSHCENLISEAQSRSEELISEHEVTRSAEMRAKEIISSAEKTKSEIMDAVEHNKNEIMSKVSTIQNESESYSAQRRKDADHYAKEVLFSMEERLSSSLAQIRKGLEAMESEDRSSKEQIA